MCCCPHRENDTDSTPTLVSAFAAQMKCRRQVPYRTSQMGGPFFVYYSFSQPTVLLDDILSDGVPRSHYFISVFKFDED